MEKELLFVDMDGVLANYALMKSKGANPEQKGFYKNLEVIPGSHYALRVLKEKYDIYVLSTPAWSKPHSWSEKREWLGANFPFLKKKLILSHNKGLFTGRALIDDNPHWNGASNFKGEIIHFGNKRFMNWNLVLKYLVDDS